MADFTTGDTLVFPIGPTLDSSGNPVTGATWTAVSAVKPDGTTFSPTFAEIGNGLYKATVTSDQAGLWLLHSQTTVSGVTYDDFATASVADGLAGNVAITTAPIAVGDTITLYRRNDYKAAETRSLNWTTSDAGTWPDLTGATIAFASKPGYGVATWGISAAGSVITPSGAAKAVRVELAAADTLNTRAGTQIYQVRATLANGDVVTLAAGTLNVVDYIGS